VNERDRFPLAHLAPLIFLALLLWAFPLVYSLALAFTDASPGRAGAFVGAANFARVVRDARFFNSLRVSVAFAAGAVVLNVGFGLLLALAFRRRPRARRTAQVALLLPWVLSEPAVALIWRGLLDENFGWFNIVLQRLGAAPLAWRTDPLLALSSLWLASLWQGLAFSALLQMAGLSSLPERLVQAARLDGAGRGLIFRRIVWAHQRGVVLTNALLVFLTAFVSFSLPFALTGGGPLFATELSSLYAFHTAFGGRFELGYAAAQGMVILAACVALAIALWRLRRRTT
jgi:ABC-type sugar transport system permease subunit